VARNGGTARGATAPQGDGPNSAAGPARRRRACATGGVSSWRDELPDRVLLSDRPDVGRDPVEHQPSGEVDDEGDEDDRQGEYQQPLAAIGRDRHHRAGGQLRSHIEHDQGDQLSTGGLGREVVDEEKGLTPVAGGDIAAGHRRLATDVDAQILPQGVEEGDEDRQLQEQGNAGGERVDLVLAVEPHHLLLHALAIVLVLLLDLLHLRLQRLQRPHPLQLPVGERQDRGAGDDGEQDDRHPPAESKIVEEVEDGVGDVDQRLQHVGRRDHGRTSPW
jgi:hypothetical protein